MPQLSLSQLNDYLATCLQPAVITDHCPNGLQVEGRSSIHHMATAVSASLETIKRAVELNVAALIVHHGLFWNGDSYPIVGNKREKLALLLSNQISLFAYHLPLDLHQQFGNNWRAAKEMGWSDLNPFGLYKGVPIGVKGKIAPITREEFQVQLETYYQHPAVSALGGKKIISTVGLISGGAYKSLIEASQQKLDCFVTGSFDESAWNEAHEEQINFYALGHSATEKIGPKALGEHLRDSFGLEVTFIDNVNPF